jgi:histidinol phosphatase-like enzyme
MIGDRESDLQAAAAAGVESVRYTGGSLLAVVAPLLVAISAP